MENLEFECCNSMFSAEHVSDYENKSTYRFSEKNRRDWFLIKCSSDLTFEKVKELAIAKIQRVFSNGRPNFFPIWRCKFVVTCDSINFREDCHSKNPCGSSTISAYRGDIITLDREGEENGFWYLDNGKELDKNCYWKYADGSHRTTVKGSQVWSLLWNEKIKEVK